MSQIYLPRWLKDLGVQRCIRSSCKLFDRSAFLEVEGLYWSVITHAAGYELVLTASPPVESYVIFEYLPGELNSNIMNNVPIPGLCWVKSREERGEEHGVHEDHGIFLCNYNSCLLVGDSATPLFTFNHTTKETHYNDATIHVINDDPGTDAEYSELILGMLNS